MSKVETWSKALLRLSITVSLPLAVVLGPRAVAWADLQLKTWQSGKPLNAADLNAEFAKIKAAVDGLDGKLATLDAKVASQWVETISFKYGDTCNSPICPVESYKDTSTSGISQILRTSPGEYTVQFKPGVFSSAPACTAAATVSSGRLAFVKGENRSPTRQDIQFRLAADLSLSDEPFVMICVGPH